MHRRLLLAVLALCLAATAAPSRADHEADHRYTVRGYVLDADEQPLAGERVVVSREGRSLGAGLVESDGFYSVQMHLHDEDIGSELTVAVAGNSATIRMEADIGDDHSERIHWASFVGDRFSEDALGRFRMPGWGWALIGVAGIVLIAWAGDRVQRARKKRARAEAVAAGAYPSTGTSLPTR